MSRFLRPRNLLPLAAGAIVALAVWSSAFAIPFLHVAGDSDGDHIVDGSDGAPAVYCGASHSDIDGNGFVNSVDLLHARNAFGQEPPTIALRDQNHNDKGEWLDELLVHKYFGQNVGAVCTDPVADPTPTSGQGAFTGPDIVVSAPTSFDGTEPNFMPFIYSSGATDGQRGHFLRLGFDETVVQAVSVTNDHPQMLCTTTIDNTNDAPGPDGTVIFRCQKQGAMPPTTSHVGQLATFEFDVIAAGAPTFCIARYADSDAIRGTFTAGTDVAPQIEPAGATCGSAPAPLDSDDDMCSNIEEWGSTPALGGRRNPQFEYDFYDVNGSAKVDSIDIALVRSKFSQDYPPYDRSPGAAAWAPGPPDGTVNAVDIALVRASFNHSCQASP